MGGMIDPEESPSTSSPAPKIPLGPSIVGTPDNPVNPRDQQELRNMLYAAGPSVMPDSIVMLPPNKYHDVTLQVRRGAFGNSRTSSGNNQENFGSFDHPTTPIGEGFSFVPQGRMYLDSQLFHNPKDLEQTFYHELGHFVAGPKSNEEQANAVRDKVFNPRAKVAAQILTGAKNLPLRRL